MGQGGQRIRAEGRLPDRDTDFGLSIDQRPAVPVSAAVMSERDLRECSDLGRTKALAWLLLAFDSLFHTSQERLFDVGMDVFYPVLKIELDGPYHADLLVAYAHLNTGRGCRAKGHPTEPDQLLRAGSTGRILPAKSPKSVAKTCPKCTQEKV